MTEIVFDCYSAKRQYCLIPSPAPLFLSLRVIAYAIESQTRRACACPFFWFSLTRAFTMTMTSATYQTKRTLETCKVFYGKKKQKTTM